MKSILILLLLAIFAQNFGNCIFKIPVVEISLDDEPETRYGPLVDLVLSKYSWELSFGTIEKSWKSMFDTIP